MFEDPLNTTAGRGLKAMVFLEELLCRCDVAYLKWHIEAIDTIFSNPKKIDLPMLMKLHLNLKQRVGFLAALPEQVYKLASIVFFTASESPYVYDDAVGQAKIKKWQEAPDMYSFFLQTPLKDLHPYLTLPEQDSPAFLEVVEKISKMHFRDLQEVTSKPT